MLACIFFGHRDCYGLEEVVLRKTVEGLIEQGVDTFYVGNQGQFDSMVFSCLIQLKEHYPHICVAVVLAYLPGRKAAYDPYHGYSMYLEIEHGPRRFAIERRNKWLLDHGDYCVCYVNHTWGGAYKFARMAKNRGLHVFNIGNTTL